jgi:transcription antitermination factor NusG
MKTGNMIARSIEMLKLSENPPMLHPAVSSLRELTGPWWVAHTRARNEKAFAWEMTRREIGYFLPMIRRTIFSGGRRRRSLVPLFPSYVFLSGDQQARHVALQTDRVCQVIPVDDQQQLVDELASIERILSTDASIDPVPFAVVGAMVRVSRGPFRGIVGRVVRRDNVTRLILSVSILARGAEMDIDADVLEPLE